MNLGEISWNYSLSLTRHRKIEVTFSFFDYSQKRDLPCVNFVLPSGAGIVMSVGHDKGSTHKTGHRTSLSLWIILASTCFALTSPSASAQQLRTASLTP